MKSINPIKKYRIINKYKNNHKGGGFAFSYTDDDKSPQFTINLKDIKYTLFFYFYIHEDEIENKQYKQIQNTKIASDIIFIKINLSVYIKDDNLDNDNFYNLLNEIFNKYLFYNILIYFSSICNNNKKANNLYINLINNGLNKYAIHNKTQLTNVIIIHKTNSFKNILFTIYKTIELNSTTYTFQFYKKIVNIIDNSNTIFLDNISDSNDTIIKEVLQEMINKNTELYCSLYDFNKKYLNIEIEKDDEKDDEKKNLNLYVLIEINKNSEYLWYIEYYKKIIINLDYRLYTGISNNFINILNLFTLLPDFLNNIL